jgi:hypothetical protein
MLYLSLPISQGGKTSGGRIAGAMVRWEGMWGARRKIESQEDEDEEETGGCVVGDAQRVRDDG